MFSRVAKKGEIPFSHTKCILIEFWTRCRCVVCWARSAAWSTSAMCAATCSAPWRISSATSASSAVWAHACAATTRDTQWVWSKAGHQFEAPFSVRTSVNSSPDTFLAGSELHNDYTGEQHTRFRRHAAQSEHRLLTGATRGAFHAQQHAWSEWRHWTLAPWEGTAAVVCSFTCPTVARAAAGFGAHIQSCRISDHQGGAWSGQHQDRDKRGAPHAQLGPHHCGTRWQSSDHTPVRATKREWLGRDAGAVDKWRDRDEHLLRNMWDFLQNLFNPRQPWLMRRCFHSSYRQLDVSDAQNAWAAHTEASFVLCLRIPVSCLLIDLPTGSSSYSSSFQGSQVSTSWSSATPNLWLTWL